MRASKQRRVPSALIRPALWFCACNLLAAALSAQCTNPTQVPNGTYTSGDHSQVDNNALSATNFVVSGGASATFSAGNCIQLLPGFHASAIGATVPTTFHAWVDIAPTAVSVVPNSPPQNPPLSQAFTWTVSSPSGHSNLSHVFALFNSTSTSTANACYIHYDVSSGLVYLADNTSTTWSSGFAPSGTGSATNSQCTISGTNSSPNPTTPGTQLGLTLNVTFNASSFSGTQNEYLYALDGSGVSTGWQPMGTWTVPAPPAPDFTLTAVSDSYYVQTGVYSYPSYTLIITPQNGFNSPVSFSMSWPMYGCGYPSYNPGLVTGPPWTTAVTMQCYETLQNGYWTQVTATGGGKSHTLNLYLYVSQGQQYFLTTAVSPSGAGSVSGGGWYNSGSYATITATPASGYHFTGFTGSVNSSSNPLTIAMSGAMTETANFAPNTTYYTLTTTANPSSEGSVNPSCGGGCSYSAGSQVTITASPASGYQFTGFTGSVNNSSNPLTVTLNSAMTETANFAPIATQYQLTTSVSPSGTGSISPGSGLYSAGSMTITATPNTGYAFSSFTGTYSGTTNPLTINLNGTGTITANFVPGYTISGQVTLAANGSGVSGVSVSASGSQSASAITDANGWYSLPALAGGGSYTIAAAKSGYILSAAQNFANLSSNQTASFTATPTLSINGGGSTAEVAPSTIVSMAFSLYDQAGANDIAWAQFYLSDASGGAHCYGDWGRPNALDLYDGDTGATSGFGITQTDSFCTVSLASITNSSTDPTEVTVVLNFTFSPGTEGTYSVLTQINYGSGSAGSWQALGTLTIDPAREHVLSTPTDEAPPDPAPTPVSLPSASASTTNCNDISGTWSSSTGNSFSLSQNGSAVTGTETSPDPHCGTVTWQIGGQSNADGTFTLTESNPQPPVDACGQTVTSGTANVQITSCSSATLGSGGGGTNPTFRSALAKSQTTWSRTSDPPGVSVTVDIMAGKITTQLSGQNKTSNLSISANSSQGQQTSLTSHASAQSGNSFSDAFRLSLPVGQYGNVVATWDTTSVTVPVAFYVVGNTRLTQYNTPYEQNCHDSPQTAYVINKIDKAADGYCYWKVVQLGRQFVTQVITNGTGVIGTNEIVKAYNAGARNVCDIPTGGTSAIPSSPLILGAIQSRKSRGAITRSCPTPLGP